MFRKFAFASCVLAAVACNGWLVYLLHHADQTMRLAANQLQADVARMSKDQALIRDQRAMLNSCATANSANAGSLAALTQTDTVLVSETGPGPSMPVFNGLFRIAVPAGGRETVIWHVPLHVVPDVGIDKTDGAGAALAYYYVSSAGQVLSGPLSPQFHNLGAGQ